MIFEFANRTGRGPRPVNEDCADVWSIANDAVGALVADGLGGMGAGDVASKTAASKFRAFADPDYSSSFVPIVRSIHEEIRSLQASRPEYRGMATTLTAIVITGDVLHGVHCGDTRVYVARGAQIRQLTEDHSEAERLYKAGKITRTQLRNYPRKNILESALGIQGEPRIDEFRFRCQSGDIVLLTSDGIHGKLDEIELARIVASGGALSIALSVERELAQLRADDNYSIVVIRLT